jgi:hypothetical protein
MDDKVIQSGLSLSRVLQDAFGGRGWGKRFLKDFCSTNTELVVFSSLFGENEKLDIEFSRTLFSFS